MSLPLRLTLLAILIAGLGAMALLIGAPSEPPGSQTHLWQRAQQCAECHADVFAEWQGSHHQIAYLNPEVRRLSDDFRNKECQACHLPRPVAVTGYGQRTLPRLSNPDEGVSCLTCHLAADGGILGRHDRPQAPCAPRASADFAGIPLCASCHNQHQTTDQWRMSDYARDGTSCHDCHMPPAPRANGQGRHHGFAGAHDSEMLRRAAEFTVARDGADLLISLSNVGAGHNFPTEERHRAVDVLVRFDDAGDWQRVHRFRQPYRDEPGENTQLPAHATKDLRIAIPAGAANAQARLWYRLTPFCDDDDPRSTLLFERQLVLK